MSMPDRRPVLVVDDDPDVVALAVRVLDRDGWRVVATTDPREAAALAVKERPFLAIVDLMMPHLDGEELVHELRRALGEQAPKVVVASAAYARADISQRLGAEASLDKPFDIDDLRDVVARFGDGHRDPSVPPRSR